MSYYDCKIAWKFKLISGRTVRGSVGSHLEVAHNVADFMNHGYGEGTHWVEDLKGNRIEPSETTE